MAVANPSAVARLARVPVDPELLLIALAVGSYDRKGARSDPDILADCTRAYVEYIGLEDEPDEDDGLTEDDAMVIGALACRLVALADVLEHGDLADRMSAPGEEGEDARAVVIEAACTAQLLEVGGVPRFQKLDFLSCVARIEKEISP